MGGSRSRWSRMQLIAAVTALSTIAGVPAVAHATSYSPGTPNLDGISSTSTAPCTLEHLPRCHLA